MTMKHEVGDAVLITDAAASGLPDHYQELCGKIIQCKEQGAVLVELLYQNYYHNVQDVVLAPSSFKRITLTPFDVTVSRTGYVPGIMAVSEEQAIKIADMFITTDDVNWSEDWCATDAQEQSEQY